MDILSDEYDNHDDLESLNQEEKQSSNTCYSNIDEDPMRNYFC